MKILSTLLFLALSFLILKPTVFSQEMWKNEAFGDENPKKELVHLRDQTTKHFINSDGTVTAHLAAGPIHYSEGGEWKTIYHSIAPYEDGYKNVWNTHKTYYPKLANQPIRTIFPSGHTLIDLIDLKMYFDEETSKTIYAKEQKGNTDFNKLTYSNVFGDGIDLQLTQNTINRKLDYIIHNKSALGTIPTGAKHLIFEESVQLPKGWKATLENNEILLIDQNGRVQAKYEKPVFMDTPEHSHDHEMHNERPEKEHVHKIQGEYKISQSKNMLNIQTLVPVNWIISEHRAYPLIIDPTFNYYPNNASNWTGGMMTYSGTSSHLSTSNTYTTSNIDANYNGDFDLGRSSGNYVDRGWSKFNISSIPDNACVSSAEYNYYVDYDATNNAICNVAVNIREMANDPVSGTPENRLDDIRDGDIYQTTSFANNGAGGGWKSRSLVNHLNNIDAQLPADWFAIGFETYEGTSGHTTCYIGIRGYSNSNKPYLRINYTPAFIRAFDPIGTIQACAGETKTINVTVNNTGCQPWTSGWTLPNTVNLSWWGSWQGGQDSNPRILPFSNLAAGSDQTIPLSITAPTTPGTYTVNVDLVRDAVCWFRSNGGGTSCGPGNSAFQFTLEVKAASSPPATLTGDGALCHGNPVDLSSSGGSSTPEAVDVWFEGSCDDAYVQLWNAQPFGTPNTTVNSVNGILNVTSTSNDPMIDMSALGSFDPAIYRYINIRYRVLSGTAGNTEIFFYNTAHAFAVGGETGFGALNSDGNWNILSIDMHQDPDYLTGGNITGWRYDWATANGVNMEIDFITLSEAPISSEGSALSFSPGDTDYPTQTTTYYTKRFDNCWASPCNTATITLPPMGTTLSQNGESATCTVNQNGWVHFYHSSGRLIGSINSLGRNLGDVTMTTYVDGSNQLVPACDDPSYETSVMQRHWLVNDNPVAPFTPDVQVGLPFSNAELSNLVTSSGANSNPEDNVGGIGDVLLSRYHGPANEDADPLNNCSANGGTENTTLHGQLASGPTTDFSNVTGASYVVYNVPGFSELWLHGSSITSPLPVEMTSFTTSCHDAYIEVEWETASELNASHYVLERSRDGSNWEVVSTIDAAGTTSQSSNYSFNDFDGALKQHVLYYRLVQVDFDGEETIYGPISANCKTNENSISVYPNPATNHFVVNVHSASSVEKATLAIYDVSGKLIHQMEKDISEGENDFYYNGSSLAKGLYTVRIISSDKIKGNFQPVKLVIQ